MESWLKSLLISFLLLIIIVIFLNISFLYLTPFIIAVLLASLINPIVNKFERIFLLERPIITFLVLSVLVAVLILFIIIGISQMYIEINGLLDVIPDYNFLKGNISWFFKTDNRIGEIINRWQLSAAVEGLVKDNLQLLYNTIKDGLIYLANNLLNILGKLPLVLSILVLSFIATYFISRDVDQINRCIMGLFPVEIRPKIYRLEKDLISSAMGFLRAELILILITGILSYLGFLLIGNDFALLCGFFTALLDLIPFIGPGLLFIPWILINMISGNLLFALKLLILFTIITAIRQGIEGRVFAYHLGLHPLLTMIGIYVGYRLMGPLGFIIGPASLVLGKAICNSGISNNLISFRE